MYVLVEVEREGERERQGEIERERERMYSLVGYRRGLCVAALFKTVVPIPPGTGHCSDVCKHICASNNLRAGAQPVLSSPSSQKLGRFRRPTPKSTLQGQRALCLAIFHAFQIQMHSILIIAAACTLHMTLPQIASTTSLHR